MVIQKINEDGKVEVFQVSSNNFQWTFENRRARSKADEEYFPFSLSGNSLDIFKRSPGAETETHTKDKEIIFCDDYGVPAGTVIGVLFPKNYIPDVIKFKDKPYIPVGLAGQVTTTPPGQIQIFYSHFEKRCAIVFNIHQNIVFGFKCISRFVDDDQYPDNGHINANDLFDITLSRELLNVESISSDDLKFINETLNKADLDDIHKTLNELLDTVKAGHKEKGKSLLSKASNLLLNGTSVVSSLTTIADSYKTGGAAHQFIGRIVEYAKL